MRRISPRGGSLAGCLAIALVTLACSAVPAGATTAKGDHWYVSKGTTCVRRPGLTGAFAQVRMLMHADDFPSTTVQAFKVSARLVPTTAGLNISRPWTTFAQKLTLSGEHSLVMTVFAPVPDTAKDWNVQIHMTWDRSSRVDWHNDLLVKNFGGCPGQGMGVGSG